MGLNVHQGIAAIHTAMSTAFRSGLSSPLAFGIFELFCTRVQHLMSNLWLSLCTDVASSVATRMGPVQISHDRPLAPSRCSDRAVVQCQSALHSRRYKIKAAPNSAA